MDIYTNLFTGSILGEIASIIESSGVPVDSSIFEMLVNQRLNFSYSKYFYASVALHKLNERSWHVVQNKVFWSKPIPFDSLIDLSRQYLVADSNIEENVNRLLEHVLITEKDARSTIGSWKAYRTHTSTEPYI